MAGKGRTHLVSDLVANGKLVIGDGYRARNSELSSSGLPFARAGNINDGFRFEDADHFPSESLSRVGNKVSQPGDVVFTSKGTVGRFALVQETTPTFVYSPQLCFWRSLEPEFIWPKFLYYWMNGPEFYAQYKPVAGQTDMADYVSLSDQRRMRISVPGRSTQRAIAHILGTLDDKIELNRRTNETLETMARALFKSWFIDFDPVRSKAEGRAPAGMDAATAALFPGRFQNSEMGPIPEGWTVEPLDTIADFRNGLALQRFRPAEGEPRLPVVKIAQLRTGQADSGEWARADITPACILEDGDVVFSWSGSLTVVVWCGGQAALNQHLFKVTSERSPKWFHLHWLLRHLPEFQRIAADKATTMGHIQRHHLTVAKCAVPPEPMIETVTPLFESLLERQMQLDLESQALANLRDTLLPRLLSGELSIPDAERFAAQGSP